MKFKITKDEFSAIDTEAIKELYVQDGENYVLKVEGIPTEVSDETQAEMNKIKIELDKERKLNKELQLDKNKPKDDTTDLKNPTLAALKLKQDELNATMDAMKAENERLKNENFKKTVEEQIIKAASNKLKPEAIDDLLVFSRITEFANTDEGDIVTSDGVKLNDWMNKTIERKPHWHKENVSGGAINNTKGNINSAKARYNEIMKKDNLSLKEQAEALKLNKEIKNGE